MTKRKRIVLLGVLIFIGLIIYLYFRLQQSRPSDETSLGNPPKLFEPNVDSLYKGKYSISLALNDPNLRLPEKIPVFSLSNTPFTEDQIQTISTNLDINSEPIRTNGKVFGPTLVYSTKDAYLRIIPNSRIVDYKKHVSVLNPFTNILSDTDTENIARAFLKQKQILINDAELSLAGIKKLNQNEDEGLGSNKSTSVNSIDITFTRLLNNSPIITEAYNNSLVRVSINSKSEVYAVYIQDIVQPNPVGDYPARNLIDITASLENEAKLQSLDNGKIDLLANQTGLVSDIQIKEISLAYYLANSSANQVLQPYYLLKGIATLKDGSDVPSELIIRAISKNFNLQ